MSYRGYKIDQELSAKGEFTVSNANGRGLFYCISTEEKAKRAVDSLISLRLR